MAVNIASRISITLSNTVNGAITAVKAIRATESARKESEFQKAVSNGMSYDAQIKFRQQQLADETKSSFTNSDYIDTLNNSISSLKKLSRFEVYRGKYSNSLKDLASGKESAQQHLDMLNQQLNLTQDPELKAEINGEIVTATQDVKTYNDNVVANESLFASKDGTIPILEKAISDVQDKKANASINGNEDEANKWAATLTTLTGQLSTVKIQNSMNNFQVNDLTKGSDGVGKLDFLNSQIKNADGFSPVVIGGKNYDSAKQYWQLTHDSYLAGNGAGLFSNFFNEMESNFANKIKASVNQYGYVPDAIMKSYQDIFTNLKTRTDVAPYVDNITNLQSNVLGSAMGYTANSILDAAETTGDYVNASNQLTSFSTKYGVDVTTAKEKLAGSIISKTNSNGADPVPFLTKAGITPDTIKTPEVTPTTPDTTTPTTTPTTPLVSPNLPNSGSNVSSTPTATIQTALGIKNDGIYGVQTTQKVKEFQTANGLVADGIVGSKTLSKLQELNLIPPATTVTPAIPTPLVVTPPVVQPKTVAPAPVIPVTTPAPVKTPVATPTPTPKTYKVVAGDTISKIAAKLGTTANKITGYKSGDPNKINVGETLTY